MRVFPIWGSGFVKASFDNSLCFSNVQMLFPIFTSYGKGAPAPSPRQSVRHT